jgi:hypothetical protein
MNSSNNSVAPSRHSDSDMECGRPLPLSTGSPAAAEDQTMLDGQQAGLLKAAAGCRSPRRWPRRLLWTLICLVSLLTLYYQWENWRGARELKAAHARLIQRVGTDDPVVFAPPTIPDEQNFFALPVIEQWATKPLEHGSRFKGYDIPKDAFVPTNFTPPKLIEAEAGLPESVDWAAWSKSRDLQGETAAVVMNRELGDANGLLPKLAAGLSRPFACLKPGLREAFVASNNPISQAAIPNVGNLNSHMRDLTLHLRAAAHAGDAAKTQTTALVALRFFPESCAAHGVLVTALQSIATHRIAFDALHDALSCPVWDERGLTLLQAQLAKDDDLQIINRALMSETLWVHAMISQARRKRASFESDGLLEIFSWRKDDSQWWMWWRRASDWLLRLGPIGWLDSDNAAYIDQMLETIGPDSDTAWIEASSRTQAVRRRVADQSTAVFPLPNVRRWISCIGFPNIGSLYAAAAETLFHRRCLILACELEKHRIRHGGYPASLPEMKGFQVNDPARPKHPPGYRLEKGGYLLWSAGLDAIDDGGMADKDWLWRMKRTP